MSSRYTGRRRASDVAVPAGQSAITARAIRRSHDAKLFHRAVHVANGVASEPRPGVAPGARLFGPIGPDKGHGAGCMPFDACTSSQHKTVEFRVIDLVSERAHPIHRHLQVLVRAVIEGRFRAVWVLDDRDRTAEDIELATPRAAIRCRGRALLTAGLSSYRGLNGSALRLDSSPRSRPAASLTLAGHGPFCSGRDSVDMTLTIVERLTTPSSLILAVAS
jgi:hypothetical protein